MATESVKILIEAEDKATAKLRSAVSEQEKAAAKAELARVKAQKSIAAERIELEQGAEAAHAFRLELDGVATAEAALIAREKELLAEQKKRAAEQKKLSEIGGAKTTKSGAEFFGAIAGIAGGGEIASVASQIGGLTEKTSQFSEVAKTGGASAMLFQAGLVGAAAAIGVQLGSTIGSAIFGVEQLKNELAEARQEFDRLEAKRLGNMQESFNDFLTDLEFAPDQTAAVNAEIERIEKNLRGVEAAKRDAQKQLAELEKQQNDFNIKSEKQSDNNIFTDAGNAISSWWNSGEIEASIAQQQQMIDARVKEADALRENKKELERLMGVEKERAEMRLQAQEEKKSAEYLQGLRDELEMVRAEIDGKANELKAQRGAGATFDDDEALRLLNETDAAKKVLAEQQKAQQQKEQEAEREKQRAKSIEDLKQRELDKIEEEITLLGKSKEAAHALRLEKMGMSKEDAQKIAAAQAELDALQQSDKANKGQKATSLNATESRLLTRGPEQDAAVRTAEHTKITAEAATKQLEEIRRLRDQMKPKDNLVVAIETVGKNGA